MDGVVDQGYEVTCEEWIIVGRNHLAVEREALRDRNAPLRRAGTRNLATATDALVLVWLSWCG